MSKILDAEGQPLSPPMAKSWTELVPMLVQVAAKAPQEEARRFALEQLLKLAEVVDRHIAQLEALRDALPDKENRCPECGVRNSHAFGCSVASTQLQATDHVCAECGSVNTTCDKCSQWEEGGISDSDDVQD